MPITFAENFANDDYLSIVDRYPGSIRYNDAISQANRGWPMYGTNTGGIFRSLNLPFLPSADRIEIVLETASVSSVAGAYLPWTVCGLEILDVTSPRVGGTSTGFPRLYNATQMHFILERQQANWFCRMFVNIGEEEHRFFGYVGLSLTNQIGYTYASSSIRRPNNLPDYITSIVVAENTLPGTRLGPVNFTDLPLTITTSNDWTFSDTGFVADVDKDEGMTQNPYITAGLQPIEYTLPAIPEDSLVTVYGSGNSDLPQDVTLDVAGVEVETTLSTQNHSVFPPISTAGSQSILTLLTTNHNPVGIGTPGLYGFGAGVCPEPTRLTSLGLSAMTGTDDPLHVNYGNYQHTNGGISVFIPKFYYRIGYTGARNFHRFGLNTIEIVDGSKYASRAEAALDGFALHRAFIDGGVEHSGFFYDKYLASPDGTASCKSVSMGQPISLTSSAGYVRSSDFDNCTGIAADAVVIARMRGTGWNVVSTFMADALSKISLAQGQAAMDSRYCAWFDSTQVTNFPKGNNNSLVDFNDLSVTFISSGESAAGKALTGSASNLSKTTHNGQPCGITDVNGNLISSLLGITLYGNSDTSTTAISNSQFVLKESSKLEDLTGDWDTSTSAWGTADNLRLKYDEYSDFFFWSSSTNNTRVGNGDLQVFGGETSGLEWLKSSSGVVRNADGVNGTGGVTLLFGQDLLTTGALANTFVMSAGPFNSTAGGGIFYRDFRYARSHASYTLGFRCGAYGSTV